MRGQGDPQLPGKLLPERGARVGSGQSLGRDHGGNDLVTVWRLKAGSQKAPEGGEILTSDSVRGLVAGKRFLFADRGDTALRGFEDPVRLYELRWREEG